MLRHLAILATATTFGLVACKTPDSTGQSQVKSEEDIEPGQIMWVGTEGKWAITCRQGRLHNGKRSALVRTQDLRTACEEIDPNAGGNGGGNGGGTGGGSGGGTEWDIAVKCPNRPERIKNLNIALSPEWTAELQALSPALATQQLCGGFVTRMNQLVTNSQSLYDNLIGTVSGSPMLVLVGKATDPVTYDSASFTLAIPWKIDDSTIDQISDQMADAGGINVCGQDGRRVLGACWYKGAQGQQYDNCNVICQKVSKIYDSKTATLAGAPQGTDDNCRAVATEFGNAFANASGCDYPSGCIYSDNGMAYRCTSATTADAPGASGGIHLNGSWRPYWRFCACK